MNILEIYQKYQIMPCLQNHQLRVAAVSKQICDNLQPAINSDNVISACLLHDMGNIVKFDLKYFPQFTQGRGEEYWLKIQQEYIAKYGKNDHLATAAICQNLGVANSIIKNINSVGFSLSLENARSNDFAKKICAYADMRVGPFGVVSLRERLDDGKIRYAKVFNHQNDEYFTLENSLFEIEKQIFSLTHIRPENITNDSIKPLFSQLEKYSVRVVQS